MAAEPTATDRDRTGAGGGRKGIVDRAWDVQHRLEHRAKRIGSGRYARVLKMARKPEPQEYRQALLIVLVGLAIIGVIGFTIALVMEFVLGLIGVV